MIAVIGDIMLDKYIYGSSTRMSPECSFAPVVKHYDNKNCIGGAGNTALNIKNLGTQVTLFCALHKNSELKNLLVEENLSYKSTPNNNIDVVKTRIISNGKYIARLDYDYLIECSQEELLKQLFTDSTSMIVISDYDKGTLSNVYNILNVAKQLNIKTLVDPKKTLTAYKGAYLLKPNLKEFSEWLEFDMSLDEDELLNKLSPALLKEAISTLEVENLLITLGANGSILVTNKGFIKKFEALPVESIDVTGAGDSFIAGLSVAINEGNNLTKAIEFATKVAGIAVTKKGTAYVKRNEI